MSATHRTGKSTPEYIVVLFDDPTPRILKEVTYYSIASWFVGTAKVFVSRQDAEDEMANRGYKKSEYQIVRNCGRWRIE